MKIPAHPSAFGNQLRVHLNSGICCSNNRGHFSSPVSPQDSPTSSWARPSERRRGLRSIVWQSLTFQKR